MRIVQRGVFAVALAVLSTSASAALQQPANGLTQTADVHAEQRAIEEAIAQIRNGNNDAADTTLRGVIEAPAFRELAEKSRHDVLYLAGALTLDRQDYERAHDYFRQSSTMSESIGNDWLYRFEAAYALKDMSDAAQSLTTLAGAWPDTVARLQDRAILRVSNEAGKLPEDKLDIELLDALFKMRWTEAGGVEPSDLWRRLVLLRLQHNDIAGARAAAERITRPYALLDMRADNQYQPVIKTIPARFDVGKAAVDQVVQFRRLVDANPRSLQWLTQLTYALLSIGHFEEVLKLTDEAIARAKPLDGQGPAYDDIGSYLIWVMDNRALALEGLKRWDDAVAQMLRAVRRPENGDLNVSQAINLGFLYFELDRPDEALATISEVGDMSPYGRMQMEMVRLVAALEKQDSSAVDKSLQYMRDHRLDAANTFLEALLYANRMDEASQFLQSRLSDRLLRSEALQQIQQYAEAPAPPRETEMHNRLRILCARPEVVTAVAKVGRIEHYEIYPEGG